MDKPVNLEPLAMIKALQKFKADNQACPSPVILIKHTHTDNEIYVYIDKYRKNILLVTNR